MMDTIDFSMIRHEDARPSDVSIALFEEFDKNPNYQA
jgi:hypothetical protein